MRLDHFISERYDFTGNKSQAIIKNGLVRIDGTIIKKPSYDISGIEGVEIIPDKSIHWVSRSAGKLDTFLMSVESHFGSIDFAQKHALDIGSSTGGFTQVLLEHRVEHVDAIDVGRGQLHTNIRNNKKVSIYEDTDIRSFTAYNGIYGIITVDVSFISLREIVPTFARFADKDTYIFLLFKPQFEVGRGNLRPSGVPKSQSIIDTSRESFHLYLTSLGYIVHLSEKASVIGEAGNQEWMMYISKG